MENFNIKGISSLRVCCVMCILMSCKLIDIKGIFNIKFHARGWKLATVRGWLKMQNA